MVNLWSWAAVCIRIKWSIISGITAKSQVRRYLLFAKFAKQTLASGACACTGVIGPGLGGGFGRLQGYFGLILDNIIEMDVVLADGSMIKVSESSHPDLYWGMRGAGHNFGIVTRFKNRVYDIPYPYWYIETLEFTNDKLEEFFKSLNAFSANGTQPKEATTYSLYALDPAISATEVRTPAQGIRGYYR